MEAESSDTPSGPPQPAADPPAGENTAAAPEERQGEEEAAGEAGGGVEENDNDNDNENEEEEEDDEEDADEALIMKANALMDKITLNIENPSPSVLHALASILETQESSFMEEETGHTSLGNGRSNHIIGRLGSLLRENDEFFELISSRFLTESTYSESVQAAALRLLFSCSLTWMYPHVFEDNVLDKIKGWAIEESTKSSGSDQSGVKKSTDVEMLRTYSTGLLAVCLASGGQVVEDVLTSGLAAKLMRYLRIRVLGETGHNQKDISSVTESKSGSMSISIKARDEGRGRLRQVSENSHMDDSLDDQIGDNRDRRTHGDEIWVDGELGDTKGEDIDTYETESDWHVRDLRKSGNRPLREDDEDSSRQRVNRGLVKSRGKGRVTEAVVLENDQAMTSPNSVKSRGNKERSAIRNQDMKKNLDIKKSLGKSGANLERDDNDGCFQECKIGSRDFADLVKKAVRAAEAEAQAANAPAEAVRAAGDAAAELVKSAALEEFTKTNDEEAAVLAASRAASTVVDAGNAVDFLRSSSGVDNDLDAASKSTEQEVIIEEVEEFFILDNDSLGKVREKFCIQCLVILGEYVEVLGPVLHEKGVDVCLALLQRTSKHKDSSEIALLLPDILKLIGALAAHRKFAAVFVDRGGMQKMLAVPRNNHTFFGLSSCLFTFGSIQGIMERVCALPSNIVHELIQLALELLVCTQDQARKNSALFFAAAFVFRAVIDAFDSQEGLQKMLNLLQDAASVRSGVTSGTLPAGSAGSSNRSPAEVLTSSEKQIAYHTCVALRQYFRAHLLLLVDLIRPNKSTRSAARNIPSSRAAYKPLDISNEAMDAVFRQLQKDRKLGPALARARWHVVDKFLNMNGHVTMLELCQAPPVERYLHDLLQYALGILHTITLVPYSRKPIVSASLSNDRVGIAVILDAANGAGFVEPEIIQAALNVLVNLVCPAPSISLKPSMIAQGQQQNNVSNVPALETRERNGESSVTPQTPGSTVASGLVGDRRISLGAGAGGLGLAAQLEQGYYHAREAVRSNNGIKALIQLLQPRIVTHPGSIDCLRALACRVLLGLARDDTIAQILTKLQVGKKLSELIRDSGSPSSSEQNRWQSELVQVAIELIGVVTNSGRANTLAATDAATPTLRRIERAAIAAATPITYHSRELLLLIHEHLRASGLSEAATTLLKEAQLTPLPSLAAPSSLAHQTFTQEASTVQIQWPAGRGFMSDKSKHEDSASHLKKKSLSFSSTRGGGGGLLSKTHPLVEESSSIAPPGSKSIKKTPEAPSVSEMDTLARTPIVLPLKRKLTDFKDLPSGKRLNTGPPEQTLRSPACATPVATRRTGLPSDANLFCTPKDRSNVLPSDVEENQSHLSQLTAPPSSSQHGLLSDPQPPPADRLTLDSIVVQYLKHQHRQCPAPITTLPPLSLLHSHVCPEPRRSLDAPSNATSRLSTREFRSKYGGMHGSRKDRQFVYSRFRPWRTCRDEAGSLSTCIAFLGGLSRVAVGNHSGDLKMFDSNISTVIESCVAHQTPMTLLQSYSSGVTQLLLSSSVQDVRLWDATNISGGPQHSFDGCKAARFSNSGTLFAALSSESTRRDILLYDIQTATLDLKLTDTSNGPSGRGHLYSQVHFSPNDSMLLWNGVLWDRRESSHVHRFDQFTDYGGGGFHPAGNEVIINSEVWDLRKFRLLRSVPSLDQTHITFNAGGDVIYAILRRNFEDVMSAFQTRRVKHPLFSAFRTVDAVNYCDIVTIPVDRCVLDFATEPTDSFVGLVTMDDESEMYSSARLYEIGRRKPTDDDSDPDDAEESDEEDEEDDDDDMDRDGLLDIGGLGDSDGDDDMNSDDDDDSNSDDDDEEDDNDFMMDDGTGALEFVIGGSEDDDDDDSDIVESFSDEDDEDL